MKNLRLLLIPLMMSFNLDAQTIYTADNNPGAPGGANTFTGSTALTDAITAASAGDIIHVVRSAVSYGAITIDKELNIFGIGLNADTDGNTFSSVSVVTIADPLASNTRLSGLNITNQISLGGVTGTLMNLLIENSRIRWIQHADATTSLANIIIRNNVIGSGFSTTEEKIDLIAGSIANIVIANNVLYQTGSSNNHGVITASNNTSVENNLFIGQGYNAYYAFEDFNGNSVKNNIFFRLRPTGISGFSNNTFENNICYSTGTGSDFFSTSSGNTSTNNLIQNPLLTNVPSGGSIDYSTFDPTLQVGSPCIGTGEGGTDMGVYGGTSPMNLEGTLIPTIQSLTLPSIVVQGDDLPVQIKAKGN